MEKGWEELQKELGKLPPSLRLYYLAALLDLVVDKKLREVIQKEIESAQEETEIRKDWKRVATPIVTTVRGLGVPLQKSEEDQPVVQQEDTLEAAVIAIPLFQNQGEQLFEYGVMKDHQESYWSAKYGAFTQEELMVSSRAAVEEELIIEMFEKRDYTPLRSATAEQTKTEIEQMVERVGAAETYKKKTVF